MTSTLYEDLWRVWKEYIDYYVVENRENKEVLFHTFLGTLMTWNGFSYIESSRQRSMRMHIFMIQDSGTGKSELMKALHSLVEFLGIPCRMTVKDNEASLTGTVYKNPQTEKVEKIPGLLSKLFLLTWDEGSVLLKNSAYMDILTDIFQVVMDEPGRVSKGMRMGTVEYGTKVTVVAGSYMFDSFRETLISKGFLQRMYITYKKLEEAEKRNIRIGVNLLKMRKNPKKIQEVMNAMKHFYDKIQALPQKTISFNDEDVLAFNKDLEDIYEKFVQYQFVGEKQKILETFYSRLHTLIDKVAAQHAILTGKGEVRYDDMVFAKDACQHHINSLLGLFDFLSAGKITTTEDERKTIIINKLRGSNEGKMTQTEVLDALRELKSVGKWDLGYNRSLGLINSMVEDKLVHVETGPKNAKILIIR